MSPSCEVLVAFRTHLTNAVSNNIWKIEFNSMNLSLHPGLAAPASEVTIDAVVDVDILLESFQANL